jgi:pilus assembly protein CpaE
VKLLDYDIHKLTEIQVELDVLLLACTERVSPALQQVLTDTAQIHHSLIRYSSNRPLRDDLGGHMADVVILEISAISEALLEDIRQFAEKRGHDIDLFVTLPSPDTQSVKLLLQAGVADILDHPFNHEEIARALIGTRERQRRGYRKAGPGKNAITAFMRTHPNAGGSFMPLNVAWQLASQFRKSTVLVDMDIQFGTVATELDIKSDNGLLEALRNPERIDKVFLDALITRHESGLNVLASPGDLSPCDFLNRKAVARLISVLAETHEHVVINLPLFFNEAVQQVIRQTNPIFLVTQGGMSALRNLRMIMNHVHRHGIPDSHIEIVQLEASEREESVKTGVLQKLAGECLVHRVHHDHKLLIHADNEGRAASELFPRAELVKDIRNIASRIAGKDESADRAKKRSRLRWFN